MADFDVDDDGSKEECLHHYRGLGKEYVLGINSDRFPVTHVLHHIPYVNATRILF